MIAEARSEIAERRGWDGRKVFGQFVSTSIVALAVVLMSSWYNYGQGCYCRGSDGMARSSTRRERRAPGTAPNVVLLETQKQNFKWFGWKTPAALSFRWQYASDAKEESLESYLGGIGIIGAWRPRSTVAPSKL